MFYNQSLFLLQSVLLKSLKIKVFQMKRLYPLLNKNLVILDYLEPRAKKMMQNLSKAHICEIDYDAQDVEHLYEVHIYQVFQLPFDVESFISVTG